MNKPRSSAVERAVRIELLRARAALEREALAHEFSQLTRSLDPRALVQGLMPRFGGGSGGSHANVLLQAVRLARRFPVLTSTVSAWLLGGKRSRLFRLASGALLGWQMLQAWRSRGPGPDQPASERVRAPH